VRHRTEAVARFLSLLPFETFALVGHSHLFRQLVRHMGSKIIIANANVWKVTVSVTDLECRLRCDGLSLSVCPAGTDAIVCPFKVEAGNIDKQKLEKTRGSTCSEEEEGMLNNTSTCSTCSTRTGGAHLEHQEEDLSSFRKGRTAMDLHWPPCLRGALTWSAGSVKAGVIAKCSWSPLNTWRARAVPQAAEAEVQNAGWLEWPSCATRATSTSSCCLHEGCSRGGRNSGRRGSGAMSPHLPP